MPLSVFLANSEYIDWHHPLVMSVSHNLSVGAANAVDVVRKCFELVSDKIENCLDYRRTPIICRASDVLIYRIGSCYAKSHLFAALLRANAIPAALCYQRLSRVNSDRPYSLHGLNAVWLKEYGWFRIDATGIKSGQGVQFCPLVERLPFPLQADDENLQGRYAEPLPEITQILTTCATEDDLYGKLSDACMCLNDTSTSAALASSPMTGETAAGNNLPRYDISPGPQVTWSLCSGTLYQCLDTELLDKAKR